MNLSTRHRTCLAAFTVATLIVGCNPSPTAADNWGFQDRDGTSSPDDADTNTVVRDTSPDILETDTSIQDASPDTTFGTWSGWFIHDPSEHYLIPDSKVNITSGGDQFQRSCNLSFQPDQPTYAIEPTPPRTGLWRLRQPAATRDPGSPVELSERRVGFLAVTGKKMPAPNSPRDAKISNELMTLQACKTLQTLGRCAAPNAGDLCYTGIQPLGGTGSNATELTLQTSMPDPATVSVSAHINFSPGIADVGRDVSLQFDFPRFDSGRHDGRLQYDWSIDQASSGSIRRLCSSWGTVTRVTYDLSDTTGWVHRIPASERSGDESLMMVNLQTGVGQLQAGIPPRSDAGAPPRPDCSTSPIELWFAAKYG
jgi:hypothetical protein